MEKIKPDYISTISDSIGEPSGASLNKIDNTDEPSGASLKTETELIHRNIKPGSPVFINFGLDFRQKYDRLQQLKIVHSTHANHDNTEILELDLYLYNKILSYFAPIHADEKHGIIKTMILDIASKNRMEKTVPALLLKINDLEPVYTAIGANGSPIANDSVLMQFSAKHIAAGSDLLSKENIVKKFKALSDSRNIFISSFSFLFRLNQSGDLVVSLFINGNADVKYSNVPINDWLR